MVLLWMAPVTLQAGWGWGNKGKEEKKESRIEQNQEDTKLRKTPVPKTPEEKQAAIEERRAAQTAENKVLQQAVRDKQTAEWKAKLDQNTKLTEAQKEEILAAREKRYERNAAFGDQRRSENSAFFQNFANDPNMTEAQKREAIRAHFQSQKSADQAFRQQQNAEKKAEREKIRSEVSSSANTVAQ